MKVTRFWSVCLGVLSPEHNAMSPYNPFSFASVSIPSAASSSGSYYVLSTLLTEDYPWACRCSQQQIDALLKEGDTPSWDFSTLSSVSCVGNVESSKTVFCDPSNESIVKGVSTTLLPWVSIFSGLLLTTFLVVT